MKDSNPKLDAHRTLLRALGLEYLIGFSLSHKSNFNPFHNASHAMKVSAVATALYRNTVPKEDKSKRGISLVAVASLLQDWGHMGGEETSDEENISHALHGIKYLSERLVKDFDDKFPNEVVEIVKCTIQPFRGVPKTIEAEVVRDATYLRFLSPGCVEEVMEGLRTEEEARESTPISYMDMYHRLAKLLTDVKLTTRIGKLWFSIGVEPALSAYYEHALEKEKYSLA